jgi:hypothetical protein
LKVEEYHGGFFSLIRLVSNQLKFSKLKLDTNHHKSYVYQGLNFLIHNPFDMFSRSSTLYQSVVNNSIMIYVNPQRTMIEEGLKGFRPKRLVKRNFGKFYLANF